MKCIAFLGDSHTWGEGSGGEYLLSPRFVSGERRRLPFSSPSFVTLIAEAFARDTDSRAAEHTGASLTDAARREGDCAVLGAGEELTFTVGFALARLFLRGEGARLDVSLDGVPTETRAFSDPLLHPLCLHAPEGTHRVTLRAAGAPVFLQRAECYVGAYAIVNCGVGSTPTARYLSAFFEEYVGSLAPHALVIEGCAINDWIAGGDPDLCRRAARDLIRRARTLTDRILCFTPSPICGAQTREDATVPYSAYCEAFRAGAVAEAVPFVDCYARFEACFAGLSEEERFSAYYHDKWHPNAAGHALYAAALLPEIQKNLL